MKTSPSTTKNRATRTHRSNSNASGSAVMPITAKNHPESAEAVIGAAMRNGMRPMNWRTVVANVVGELIDAEKNAFDLVFDYGQTAIDNWQYTLYGRAIDNWMFMFGLLMGQTNGSGKRRVSRASSEGRNHATP